MSTITCGSCKNSHSSATEVKACYANARSGALVMTSQGPVFASRAATPERLVTGGISEKQLAFANKLLEERPSHRDVNNLWPSNVAKLDRREASKLIDELLDIPRETNVATAKTDVVVENGRYALIEEGVTKFFIVNTPSEGRWRGRTFVDAQASDERHAVRNTARKNWILEQIAANPREALVRYGRELGKCGMCGRTLTDEDSRAVGIGPICAGKL